MNEFFAKIAGTSSTDFAVKHRLREMLRYTRLGILVPFSDLHIKEKFMKSRIAPLVLIAICAMTPVAFAGKGGSNTFFVGTSRLPESSLKVSDSRFS